MRSPSETGGSGCIAGAVTVSGGVPGDCNIALGKNAPAVVRKKQCGLLNILITKFWQTWKASGSSPETTDQRELLYRLANNKD